MQTLSIVYNIGHFYNTFTASRAVVLFAAEDITFRNMILGASCELRYRETVAMLLDEKNYLLDILRILLKLEILTLL